MAWIGAYTTKDKNENFEDHWQLIWTQKAPRSVQGAHESVAATFICGQWEK